MDIYINELFYNYYNNFPLTLVDVGASGGIQKHWKTAEKFLRLISFEPDERSYSELQYSSALHSTENLKMGLFDKKGTVDFYLTRQKTASSIFKPNKHLLNIFPQSELLDVDEVTTINVDTLDNQLSSKKIKDIDFLKLDTQGSEFHILQGSESLLNNTLFGLEIEVEFLEIYEKQPLFHDVDRIVKQYGFQLFDLNPFYWKRKEGIKLGNPKGQIAYADTIYLKDLDVYKNMLEKYSDEIYVKSKILKAISICIIYGYLDYAYDVINTFYDFFSNLERDSLSREIKRNTYISSNIPHFRGREYLSHVFHYFWHALNSRDGRSKGSKTLGNI